VDIVVGALLGVIIASLFNMWYIMGRREKPSGYEEMRRKITHLEDQLRAMKKELARFLRTRQDGN